LTQERCRLGVSGGGVNLHGPGQREELANKADLAGLFGIQLGHETST
jgi:hypothetical protein